MPRYGLDLGQKNKSNKKKVRTLVIAFLCFAVLLGAFSYLLLWKSLNYDFNNIFHSDSTTEVATTVPVSEKTFSGTYVFGAAVTDDNATEIRFIELISVDLSEKIIRIVPVAYNTPSPTDNNITLSAVYFNEGLTSLKNELSALCGTELSRVAVFTETNVKAVFRTMGNITVNVSKEIEYDTEDMFLELNKGENVLTPEKTYKYMKYLCENNEPFEAAKKNADIVVAAFSGFFTGENYLNGDALFVKLINYCKTDISIVDYTNAKEEIASLIPNSTKEQLKVFISTDVKESTDEE